MDNQSDPEFETKKKTPVKGDNADQHIGSSESLVPEMICQFEEKSVSKSLASDSTLQQAASSPVPHPQSRQAQVMRGHKNTVIGSITAPLKTRTQVRDEVSHVCYVSVIEPRNVNNALCDDSWVNAMHGELAQFERNRV